MARPPLASKGAQGRNARRLQSIAGYPYIPTRTRRNEIRVRGLAVAGGDAAGRKSPHNHAQSARNPRYSLQNAAVGARLIQAEGLDSKSAAEVEASLADALEELHRLQRTLDRRIRRDRHAEERPFSSFAPDDDWNLGS
jgi:hypothetical protein